MRFLHARLSAVLSSLTVTALALGCTPSLAQAGAVVPATPQGSSSAQGVAAPGSASAQNPAATGQRNVPPSPAVQSMPAPTPASPSSLPSLPAITPEPQTAAPPAATPYQQGTPGAATAPYRDPLEAPIVVAPPPAGQPPPPAAVSMPTPALAASLPSLPAFEPEAERRPHTDALGSAYIPVDNLIYPMALRLYSLGYLDTVFLSARPWTQRSLLHALDKTAPDVMAGGNDEAIAILARLRTLLAAEVPASGSTRGRIYGVESVYTRLMGIGGQTLRDSYHLGETINNDYGRPYAPGFNNITGFSSLNEWGRFSLYVRGEYQHAPSSAGYSYALASQLSCGGGTIPGGDYTYNGDAICPFAPPNEPQADIPYGNTGAQNPFRLQEATLSFHLLGHEISGGKSDAWLGPAYGASMGWDDNANDIYSFRIDRVEPLYIPLLSRLTGPFRYDFFVGSLKGHTAPNHPWVHSENFAFRPTSNVEIGFQRTVVWGGAGHEPITLHTFLRSFFSLNDTEFNTADKNSAQDPGARFSAFNFSWRLPFLRHSVTLYADSEAHDDVTPPSAPRRAAYRPGVYIAQLPFLPKLDFRIEAANTDISTLRSISGAFNYYEGIQRQAYTNSGVLFGDWIGREAKGGQAWLTYHLSAEDFVQVEYLNKKNAKDFIPGGTTQNQVKVELVKRLGHDVEADAWFQYERWKAPIYLTGGQSDFVVAAQFTWYPKLRIVRGLNGK